MSLSNSKRNSIDRGSLKVNQTMFQFLKRKRHTQLQSSLKKTSSYHQSVNKQNPRLNSAQSSLKKNKANQNINFEDAVRESSTADMPSMYVYSSATKRQHRVEHGRSSDLTPRKISFAIGDSIPLSTRRQSRINKEPPFRAQNQNISLNNSASKHSRESSQVKQHQPKSIMKKSTQRVDGDTNTFNKRKFHQSMEELKQSYYELQQVCEGSKSKLSELSIAVSNAGAQIQKHNDSGLLRIMGEIKLSVKQLQNCNKKVTVFHSQNKDPFEEFQRDLSEFINTFESTAAQLFQNENQKHLSELSFQKNEQISILEKENSKLQREVQKLKSHISNLENQSEANSEKQQNRISNLVERLESQKIQYQEQLREISESDKALKQQLQKLQKECKQTQRRVKDEYFQKQTQQFKLLKTQADESKERQRYLLEEISKLKSEFNNDIGKLHTLYQSKQEELSKAIEHLTLQLERERSQRSCDRQVSDRILTEANEARQELSLLKKKDKEMMTDMLRMNESLFQHWMALGDIKILSERLGIFRNFEKLYLDLAYNPNLFS